MKRAIFIVSQKGGSGKSTFSRALLDHLRYGRGMRVAAFDADGDVGQLLQCYGQRDGQGQLISAQDPLLGVGVFNMRSPDERGTVLDGLDCGAETMLFDFPAGSLGDLCQVFGPGTDVGPLLDEYTREGYRVTVAVVISNVQASVANVLEAMGLFQDRVDYVVVKNLFYGRKDDFLFFDGFTGTDGRLYGGQAREALMRHGGRVVAMPALSGREYALCDMYCLGFSEAVKQGTLRRSERSAIGHFLREFGEAVKAGMPFFGYEAQPTASPLMPRDGLLFHG